MLEIKLLIRHIFKIFLQIIISEILCYIDRIGIVLSLLVMFQQYFFLNNIKLIYYY